jgi:hypothetical protein
MGAPIRRERRHCSLVRGFVPVRRRAVFVVLGGRTCPRGLPTLR